MQARANKTVLSVNPDGENLSHEHQDRGRSGVDGSSPVGSFQNSEEEEKVADILRRLESSSNGVLIEGKHTNAHSHADAIKASS